jgi:transposase, IS30 family
MSHTHLTLSEREVIAQSLAAGKNQSQIARALGRDRSTISRELRRNKVGGVETYFAVQADWLAAERRHASKLPFAQHDERVWKYVLEKLGEEWSPEQIAGRLREEYPDDARMRISHETIYAFIYADRRAGGALWKQLRRHHRRRRPRGSGRQCRGGIVGRVGIAARPAIVEKRSRKGDWEGDTVAGKSGRLVTVVERKSRFVVIAKVHDKRAASVNRGGIRALHKVPDQFRKTMTLDNGTEFARFGEMERALNLRVYFAEPYNSNQRATNENTNGLLRQYFPKGTDFRAVSHQRVAKVQQRLNNRPRKCLGYRTPHEVLFDE